MSLITELNQQLIDRKWYQLLTIIHQNLRTNTETIVDFVTIHIEELCYKAHLKSLSTIISLLTDINKSKEIINKAVLIFSNIDYKVKEQEDFFVLLQLNYDILNYKECTRIYEYKTREYGVEALERLYLLFYLYFEYVEDFYEAYKHLLLYCRRLRENKKYNEERINSFGNKLAELSLKAENVYKFDDIMEFVKESDLLNLITAFKNGDIHFVLNNSQGFPIEKVFLIAMMQITNYKKNIKIKEIEEKLKLNKPDVLFLVFKALGKGLFEGYYDGIKRELILNKSISKTIDEEEIKEIKEKICNWKIKVVDAIEGF